MDAELDDDNPIPIDMAELAEVAGHYFAGAEIEDIPSKLWLDCYILGRQIYLRACFDTRLVDASIVRLSALAAALGERHKVEICPVAYLDDWSWEEIEARARALQLVQ